MTTPRIQLDIVPNTEEFRRQVAELRRRQESDPVDLTVRQRMGRAPGAASGTPAAPAGPRRPAPAAPQAPPSSPRAPAPLPGAAGQALGRLGAVGARAAAALGPLAAAAAPLAGLAGVVAGLTAAGIAASRRLNTIASAQQQQSADRLNRSWNAMASRIGDGVLPVIGSFQDSLADLIDRINEATGGDPNRGITALGDVARARRNEAQRRRAAAGQPEPAGAPRPPLPGLHRGGIVPPHPGGTDVTVGEGGRPEAIIPLPPPGAPSPPDMSLLDALSTWWVRLGAPDTEDAIRGAWRDFYRPGAGGGGAAAPAPATITVLTQAAYDALTSPTGFYAIVG